MLTSALFQAFPKLLLAVIAYNILVFLGGTAVDAGNGSSALQTQLFSIGLVSGDSWSFTTRDILLILALGLLFVEIVKATQTDIHAIWNHALSIVVFIICLVEFIIFRGFGNNTFFLIMIMTLVDVVAGYTVSIKSARRDIGFTR